MEMVWALVKGVQELYKANWAFQQQAQSVQKHSSIITQLQQEVMNLRSENARLKSGGKPASSPQQAAAAQGFNPAAGNLIGNLPPQLGSGRVFAQQQPHSQDNVKLEQSPPRQLDENVDKLVTSLEEMLMSLDEAKVTSQFQRFSYEQDSYTAPMTGKQSSPEEKLG